jgi:hypothetical protein
MSILIIDLEKYLISLVDLHKIHDLFARLMMIVGDDGRGGSLNVSKCSFFPKFITNKIG